MRHHQQNFSGGASIVFITGLENVKHLFIEIYSMLGQLLRTIEVTNPPPNFGLDQLYSNGLNVLPGAEYTLRVLAENDCTAIEYTDNASFDGNDYSSFTDLFNQIQNPQQNVCCDEDLIIKNKIFDNEEVFTAGRVYIQERVKITQNGKLSIKAQTLIDITPNLEIEEGGLFEAYIAPCTEAELTLSNSEISNITEDRNLLEGVEKSRKSLSLESKMLHQAYKIYPNPVVNKQLNIEIANIQPSKVYIEIYNISGQLVYQGVQASQSMLVFNLSKLSKGMYFVKLKIGENTYLPEKIILN